MTPAKRLACVAVGFAMLVVVLGCGLLLAAREGAKGGGSDAGGKGRKDKEDMTKKAGAAHAGAAHRIARPHAPRPTPHI